MYVCVLAEGPNLVFGGKKWLTVCVHMDVYIWPLQWSFNSRGRRVLHVLWHKCTSVLLSLSSIIRNISTMKTTEVFYQ